MNEIRSGEAPRYEGECYCGNVKVTVFGSPDDAGYCHCRSCRKWHAAPVNAWTYWSKDKVRITGDVRKIDLGGLSKRIVCAQCGGGVANDLPEFGGIVVYATTLAGSGFEFAPKVHIHYAERVMNVNDGLPKYIAWKDWGEDAGKLVRENGPTGWCAER